jgi:sugar phosphate isomerase/epimerase
MIKSLALSQATCKQKDIIEFIKFAKDFEGIELSFEQLYNFISKENTLKDIFEYVEIYDLKVINIFELRDFSLCSDTKFKTVIIPTLEKMMDLSYKLECDLISIVPSIETRNIPQWRIIRRTIEKVEEIAKMAYQEDMKIGFAYRNTPNSSIFNLSEAKKIIKSLYSQENLGIIIDTFYMGKEGRAPDDLIEIIDHIYLIRLADLIRGVARPSKKKNTLTKENEERLIPGRGEFNFKTLFKVSERYYKGYYSLKLSERLCKPFLYKRALKRLYSY